MRTLFNLQVFMKIVFLYKIQTQSLWIGPRDKGNLQMETNMESIESINNGCQWNKTTQRDLTPCGGRKVVGTKLGLPWASGSHRHEAHRHCHLQPCTGQSPSSLTWTSSAANGSPLRFHLLMLQQHLYPPMKIILFT